MGEPAKSPLLGYARVSTRDQDLRMQVDELKAAGCSRIFIEQMSGTRNHRPELDRALDYLRPGDTLVVWRLDRLGRSLKHLIEVMNDLDQRNVAFRSLHEAIDTSTSSGRMIFHIFAALAEFERDLIQERTSAGLAAARARGRVGGRPPKMTPSKISIARQLLEAKDEKGDHLHTVSNVAETLGVSRATIYRSLEREKK